MGNKLITDKGKTELLRLAFDSEEAGGAFKYLALGGNGSKGAQGEEFKEVSGPGYERVQTEIDKTTELSEQKEIIISGTFNESNYAPTDGNEKITEIGLCNTESVSSSQIFFMYSEVPEINKTGDISLKYTIIISID